jgi:hypothetical protein
MSPEPTANIKSGKSTVPNAGLTKARPQDETQRAVFRRQLGGQGLMRARELWERPDGGASRGNPTNRPDCTHLAKHQAHLDHCRQLYFGGYNPGAGRRKLRRVHRTDACRRSRRCGEFFFFVATVSRFEAAASAFLTRSRSSMS